MNSSSSHPFLLSATCLILLLATANNGMADAARVFQVGDEFHWQQPGQNTDFYDQWAAKNRFQIGDSLSFVYTNDSVLEVEKWGYYHCDVNNPIIAYDNGNSEFELDKPGPLYFISGHLDHCMSGQRLLVEVMGTHHHEPPPPPAANTPPESSPAPSPTANTGSLVSLAFESFSMIVITTLLGLVWYGQ